MLSNLKLQATRKHFQQSRISTVFFIDDFGDVKKKIIFVDLNLYIFIIWERPSAVARDRAESAIP